MTSTSTPAFLQHVTSAPEGIVRLFVPAGFTASKQELRNAAARIAGTINVGRTPAGKPATLKGVKGTGFDFAPVVKGATPAATPEETPDETPDPRVVALTALGLTPEQITAALAAVSGPGKGRQNGTGRPVPPITTTTRTATAAKSPREVPAFLRKWENVTCRTCRDFGKVHGPTAGDKAGKPFRTQRGADSAPTGVPCPSHVSKGKTATARRTSKTA